MVTVALIGTGVIGRAWAVVFARAGHAVKLHDADPAMLEGAMPAVSEAIDLFAEAGLIAEPARAKALVSVAHGLAEALDGAGYVQESITEKVDAKRALFAGMDRLAGPDAILASSASAIPGSDFMDVPGRRRCLVAHPVSPPSLVPLVELVPTPWTDPDTTARAKRLLTEAGQSVVVLKREIPGFVLNRLQAAVICEAMHLVGADVIDPDDLDRTMRDGLGLRWSFMGPFETMDLNAVEGIGGYLARYTASYEAMARDLRVQDPWRPEAIAAIEADRRARVPAEHLAERRRWRDRRLMRLKRLRIEDGD